VVESIWQAEGQDYTETYHHKSGDVWKTICSESNANKIEQMMIGVCALPEDHGGTARYLGIRRTYVIAGKTGTAEVGKEKEKELAWFIGFRQAKKDGTDLKADEERLVLVMLELDMNNLPDEYSMMKFMIGRVLLKDDDLTKPGQTNLALISTANE
jgi:cell division protein FtsI/penicillin-binding protein 2